MLWSGWNNIELFSQKMKMQKIYTIEVFVEEQEFSKSKAESEANSQNGDRGL